MEIVAYALMAVGAYAALVTKNRTIIYGWLLGFVFYSVAARMSPEITGDMTRYYASARTWPTPTLYILREPILWYGASLLYAVLGTEILAFLALDLLNALILFSFNADT